MRLQAGESQMGHRPATVHKQVNLNDTTCLQGWALIGQEHPRQRSYGIELGRNEIGRYWIYWRHSQESEGW